MIPNEPEVPKQHLCMADFQTGRVQTNYRVKGETHQIVQNYQVKEFLEFIVIIFFFLTMHYCCLIICKSIIILIVFYLGLRDSIVHFFFSIH